MLDFAHPFFKPMWRRVAVVAFCGCWGMIELFVQGSHFWSALFIGMGAMAFWKLFLDKETLQKLEDDS